MSIMLVILTVIAATYLYAALAFYYGFKNWVPFCGCEGGTCGPRKQAAE